MAEQDDLNWFDTLAGRKAANTDPATVKEAEAIRRALLAQKPDEVTDFDVDAGEQKLLFRMRREGLAVAPKRNSWQIYGAFAIAASMVLTVGIVVLQAPDMEDVPVYRGMGAQTINSADTAKLSEVLANELEGLGVKAKVTKFGTTFTINADWPAKPNAKQLAFLKRHGIKQPDSGPLVVELIKVEDKK